MPSHFGESDNGPEMDLRKNAPARLPPFSVGKMRSKNLEIGAKPFFTNHALVANTITLSPPAPSLTAVWGEA
jgi:hypothetical protein